MEHLDSLLKQVHFAGLSLRALLGCCSVLLQVALRLMGD